jgi:hypothetical protein
MAADPITVPGTPVSTPLDRFAVEWLCTGDPAVAALFRREILREAVPAGAALDSPLVSGLLQGLLEPATTRHPYAKWSGAHWRLISLVELGLPPGHPEGVAAAEKVLEHWAEPRRLAGVPSSRAGRADARHRRATPSQRYVRPEAAHSCFHETLPALWGLHEFATASGDPESRTAAAHAAELLLRHELLWSRTTGRPIHPSFAVPHYPPYWHYDLLQALLVLERAGFRHDPRTDRARDLLGGLRRKDDTWRAARRWWRPPTGRGSGGEVVDWGETADRMVTLNALRVGAGR